MQCNLNHPKPFKFEFLSFLPVKKNLYPFKKKPMFQSLKTSAARAGVLSTVLLLFVGLHAALLGAVTNLTFDACTNPTIRFAWTVIIKLAQHRLATKPPQRAAGNRAQTKMRRPVKTTLRTRTSAEPSRSDETAAVKSESESESEHVDEI